VTRSAGLAALALCWAAPGAAQQRPSFSAERLLAPAGGAGLVACEDARVQGHAALLLDLTFSSGHRPVVLRQREGEAGAELLVPVSQASSFQLSAAVELWRLMRVGLSLPLLSLTGDRLQGLGEDREFAPMSAGDLRMSAVWVLWRRRRAPLHLSLGAAFTLPTGDDSSFAGSGALGFIPRALLAYRPLSWLTLLGQVGGSFHAGREFYGSTWGARLLWAAGAGVDLPWIPGVGRVLGLLLETDGETCFGCDAAPTVELRGGLRSTHGRWRLTLSGGAGLGAGVTTPAWRLTLGARTVFGR
jgi:hypothetical protein